jgi:hypothetical protein
MVVKSPVKFKKTYGDLRDATEPRLRDATNYIRKKRRRLFLYPWAHLASRLLALGRFFAGVYRGVSQAFHVNVFTLDRLSLPENVYLNKADFKKEVKS